MSFIESLQSSLDVSAGVVWSVLTVAAILIVSGVFGVFYWMGLSTEGKDLATGPDEVVPLVASGAAAGPDSNVAGASWARAGSADSQGAADKTVTGQLRSAVSSLSSSSFDQSRRGGGSYSRADTDQAAEAGGVRRVVSWESGDLDQQQQQGAVQGGGPNGGGLSATERAILSEWARGVDVVLFNHARLQQGNSSGWGSSSGGLEESGGRLTGAVVEAGKASSRPRKIKLYLDGANLSWRKDKLFGSRVCSLPVADISQVTPGRTAFTGAFRELKGHDFPAKGDERYLTIVGSRDAIEIECSGRDEREALLGGLRVIVMSMAALDDDDDEGGDEDDEQGGREDEAV